MKHILLANVLHASSRVLSSTPFWYLNADLLTLKMSCHGVDGFGSSLCVDVNGQRQHECTSTAMKTCIAFGASYPSAVLNAYCSPSRVLVFMHE